MTTSACAKQVNNVFLSNIDQRPTKIMQYFCKSVDTRPESSQ